MANLHYMSCIAPMDLLILDWASSHCELLVALLNVFLFSPEDESAACFTRLSAVRSSADSYYSQQSISCSYKIWRKMATAEGQTKCANVQHPPKQTP